MLLYALGRNALGQNAQGGTAVTKWAWAKLSVAVTFAVLLLIAILQNMTDATIGFLFWQLHLPLALLAIIVFLIGAVCGLALVVYVNMPKKPSLPEEPEAPEEKPDHKGAEAAGEDSEK